MDLPIDIRIFYSPHNYFCHSRVSPLFVDNAIERLLIIKARAHRGNIWAKFDMIR